MNRNIYLLMVIPFVFLMCEGEGGGGGEYRYDITLTYKSDTCEQGDQGVENYIYSFTPEGNNVTIYVDDKEFFYGTISGSTITYKSQDWTQDRINGDIVFNITGTGTLNEQSWTGEEIIHVLSSEDPDIPAPCVYEYSLNGTRI